MKSFSQFQNHAWFDSKPNLEYVSEMTVSPNYQQRGTFNPYYTLKVSDDIINQLVGPGKLKYRCTDSPKGEEIYAIGKGKFTFQIEIDDQEQPYYIRATKSNVEGHFGMKSRKSATASSDVNEVLSMYFLIHKSERSMDTIEWEKMVAGKSGKTGVLKGDGSDVSYEDIVELLDKDETAQRDIKIGQSNAVAIQSDLSGAKVSNYYWCPQAKPGGIDRKNPSDTVVEFSDGTFLGYSNKISSGSDVTPKMNASIIAQYHKHKDKSGVKDMEKLIDSAWKYASGLIKKNKHPNAYKALIANPIKRDRYTESGSKTKFETLGKEFAKDSLNFYQDGMYYPFRNFILDKYATYIKRPRQLAHLLNIIGFYTFPNASGTPCPYKLLVGSENSSSISDVSSNEEMVATCYAKPQELKSISVKRTTGTQSLEIYWKHGRNSYMMPITMRTRSAGGWAGKALYMTSSGIKQQ